jgi:hypothetical protein
MSAKRSGALECECGSTCRSREQDYAWPSLSRGGRQQISSSTLADLATDCLGWGQGWSRRRLGEPRFLTGDATETWRQPAGRQVSLRSRDRRAGRHSPVDTDGRLDYALSALSITSTMTWA